MFEVHERRVEGDIRLKNGLMFRWENLSLGMIGLGILRSTRDWVRGHKRSMRDLKLIKLIVLIRTHLLSIGCPTGCKEGVKEFRKGIE